MTLFFRAEPHTGGSTAKQKARRVEISEQALIHAGNGKWLLGQDVSHIESTYAMQDKAWALDPPERHIPPVRLTAANQPANI